MLLSVALSVGRAQRSFLPAPQIRSILVIHRRFSRADNTDFVTAGQIVGDINTVMFRALSVVAGATAGALAGAYYAPLQYGPD